MGRRLVKRAAAMVITIHKTILITMHRIKVVKPKVKVILTKKVKILQKKAKKAHKIKIKVHVPKKVTAAFKAKVKKACKFCKENINIVKGKKKLTVVKSHKHLKAKKVVKAKK